MKEELLLCDCGFADHQIIIREDEDNEFVFLHIYLAGGRSFFKRVKFAFKYIFGYKSRYGAWDEILLSIGHYDQIQRLADRVRYLKGQLPDPPMSDKPMPDALKEALGLNIRPK